MHTKIISLHLSSLICKISFCFWLSFRGAAIGRSNTQSSKQLSTVSITWPNQSTPHVRRVVSTAEASTPLAGPETERPTRLEHLRPATGARPRASAHTLSLPVPIHVSLSYRIAEGVTRWSAATVAVPQTLRGRLRFLAIIINTTRENRNCTGHIVPVRQWEIAVWFFFSPQTFIRHAIVAASISSDSSRLSLHQPPLVASK
jgi:hypothetical protein